MNSAVLNELLYNPSICLRLFQINTTCQSLPPPLKREGIFSLSTDLTQWSFLCV